MKLKRLPNNQGYKTPDGLFHIWQSNQPGYENRWNINHVDFDEAVTSGFPTKLEAVKWLKKTYIKRPLCYFMPKGLAEFQASLYDLEYTESLITRLKDLPGFDISEFILFYNDKMKKVKQYESELAFTKKRIFEAAARLFQDACSMYSKEQLQEATGYDNE